MRVWSRWTYEDSDMSCFVCILHSYLFTPLFQGIDQRILVMVGLIVCFCLQSFELLSTLHLLLFKEKYEFKRKEDYCLLHKMFAYSINTFVYHTFNDSFLLSMYNSKFRSIFIFLTFFKYLFNSTWREIMLLVLFLSLKYLNISLLKSFPQSIDTDGKSSKHRLLSASNFRIPNLKFSLFD